MGKQNRCPTEELYEEYLAKYERKKQDTINSFRLLIFGILIGGTVLNPTYFALNSYLSQILGENSKIISILIVGSALAFYIFIWYKLYIKNERLPEAKRVLYETGKECSLIPEDVSPNNFDDYIKSKNLDHQRIKLDDLFR